MICWHWLLHKTIWGMYFHICFTVPSYPAWVWSQGFSSFFVVLQCQHWDVHLLTLCHSMRSYLTKSIYYASASTRNSVQVGNQWNIIATVPTFLWSRCSVWAGHKEFCSAGVTSGFLCYIYHWCDCWRSLNSGATVIVIHTESVYFSFLSLFGICFMVLCTVNC